MKTKLTHRCEESLENKVSIGFTKEFEGFLESSDDFNAWRLFYPQYNFDYDTTNLVHISKITYCPYCGQELPIPHSTCYILDGKYYKSKGAFD